MKQWYESHGIIGSMLAFMASTAHFADGVAGMFTSLSSAVNEFLSFVAAVSALLALYGRWRAGGVHLPCFGSRPVGVEAENQ